MQLLIDNSNWYIAGQYNDCDKAAKIRHNNDNNIE